MPVTASDVTFAALRIAGLPARHLRALLDDSHGSDDALGALLEAQPEIVALIGTASPDLAAQIRSDLTQRGRLNRRTRRAAQALVARATTRPTPLAALTSIAAAEIVAEPGVRVPTSNMYYDLVTSAPPASPANPQLFASGTNVILQGIRWVIDFRRTVASTRGTGRTAAWSLVDRSPLAETVRNRLTHAPGTPFDSLVHDVAQASGKEPDTVANAVRRAISRGEVLTQHDRCPLLRREVNRYDVKPLSNLSAAEAAMRGGSNTGGYSVDLVLSRHVHPASVSAKIVDLTARAVDALVQVAVPRRIGTALAAAFAERFGSRNRVPLAEAVRLDGLAFEGLYESARDDDAAEARDDFLFQIAQAAIAAREREVMLSSAALAALAGAAVVPPPQIEAVALLVSGAQTGSVEPALLGHVAAGRRWNARFEVHSGRREVSRSHSLTEYEVAFWPEPLSAARLVALDENDGPFIELGCRAPGSANLCVGDLELVRLADRVVLVRHGSDEIVTPRFSHAINPFAQERTVTLLYLLTLGDIGDLRFEWGSSADALMYRPRARLDGIIVAPERWLAPRAVLGSADVFAAWRERWRVPRFVYDRRADQRLLLDLADEATLASLQRTAAEAEAATYLEIEEALPSPFQDDVAQGPDGDTFIAELALTFGSRADGPPLRLPGFLDGTNPLVAPGRGWTYLKAYIAPLDTEELLRGLCPLLANRDSFFVRYADPEHHLRLRWRSPSFDSADPVFRHLCEQLGSGPVTRLEIGTYERESGRYGGPDAIDLAERIFERDSGDAITLVAEHAGPIDAGARVVSACRFLTSMLGDGPALEFIDRVIDRRRVLSAAERAVVRACGTVCLVDARLQDLYRRLTASAAPSTDLDAMLRSLYHMHCNRRGTVASDEADLLHVVRAVVLARTERTHSTR